MENNAWFINLFSVGLRCTGIQKPPKLSVLCGLLFGCYRLSSNTCPEIFCIDEILWKVQILGNVDHIVLAFNRWIITWFAVPFKEDLSILHFCHEWRNEGSNVCHNFSLSWKHFFEFVLRLITVLESNRTMLEKWSTFKTCFVIKFLREIINVK